MKYYLIISLVIIFCPNVFSQKFTFDNNEIKGYILFSKTIKDSISVTAEITNNGKTAILISKAEGDYFVSEGEKHEDKDSGGVFINIGMNGVHDFEQSIKMEILNEGQSKKIQSKILRFSKYKNVSIVIAIHYLNMDKVRNELVIGGDGSQSIMTSNYSRNMSQFNLFFPSCWY